MNNLRTPIAILVLIFVGIAAWFWLFYRGPTSVKVQVPVATSTTSVVEPASNVVQTPAPRLDPSTVATNAVGTWQSTDDPNYTVTIGSSGTWTDTYKGENVSSSVSETGSYKLFTSQNPDKNFT